MKSRAKTAVVMGMLALCLLLGRTPAQAAAEAGASEASEGYRVSEEQLGEIDRFVEEELRVNGVPGAAITIVKDGRTLYQKGYGFADVKAQAPVSKDTLFEIGSNTKAFTAIAVLQLADQGLLSLSDPVSKHIPWLKMKYAGAYADITIDQLLHHTSGIPFESIGLIPEASGADALEATVRRLAERELKYAPGAQFEYATMNYNILGLVIQTLSGKSFENYMQEYILSPLQLNHTYLFREEADSLLMAKGYRFGFHKAFEYEAPLFRGSAPSANLISNIADMDQWLKMLLDDEASTSLHTYLKQTQRAPSNLTSEVQYALGWYSGNLGTYLFHSGVTPGFSSFIALQPADHLGIAVLANGVSLANFTDIIAMGIDQIVRGSQLPSPLPFGVSYIAGVDRLYSAVAYAAVPLAGLFLLLTLFMVYRIIARKRRFIGYGAKFYRRSGLLAGFIAVYSALLYVSPQLLFQKLPWSYVLVWSPYSALAAVLAVYALGLFIAVCMWIKGVFIKQTQAFQPVSA